MGRILLHWIVLHELGDGRHLRCTCIVVPSLVTLQIEKGEINFTIEIYYLSIDLNLKLTQRGITIPIEN